MVAAAWENNSKRLEPVVMAVAARTLGSCIPAALPGGWKVLFQLVTPTTTVSGSLRLCVCFTVWRAPPLRKLCQFVSWPHALIDSVLIIYWRKSVVVLKCGFLLAKAVQDPDSLSVSAVVERTGTKHHDQ